MRPLAAPGGAPAQPQPQSHTPAASLVLWPRRRRDWDSAAAFERRHGWEWRRRRWRRQPGAPTGFTEILERCPGGPRGHQLQWRMLWRLRRRRCGHQRPQSARLGPRDPRKRRAAARAADDGRGVSDGGGGGGGVDAARFVRRLAEHERVARRADRGGAGERTAAELRSRQRAQPGRPQHARLLPPDAQCRSLPCSGCDEPCGWLLRVLGVGSGARARAPTPSRDVMPPLDLQNYVEYTVTTCLF